MGGLGEQSYALHANRTANTIQAHDMQGNKCTFCRSSASPART